MRCNFTQLHNMRVFLTLNSHSCSKHSHTGLLPLRSKMKRQPWHKVRNCTTLNHFPLFHWYSHANTSHDFAKFVKKIFSKQEESFCCFHCAYFNNGVLRLLLLLLRSETLKVRKKEGSVNVWILVDNWEQIQRCRFYDNLSWKCHHILLLSN